ncbi:MAG: hypothetical protein MJ117_05960, partial [Lachnospiraceae bacterium]|nr:hypothetical protein [Lachnospiraceae bacterium]
MSDKKCIVMIGILAMGMSVLTACGKSTDQADATEAAKTTVSVSSEPVSVPDKTADAKNSESKNTYDFEIDDEEDEEFDFEWPYPNVTAWTWEETDPRIAEISLSDNAISCFDDIVGGYKIQQVKSDNDDERVGWYWYLSIGYDEYGPSLAIYDDEAGNPGVQGYISYIDDKNITVLIDYWYYEDMPKANWS